MESEAKVELTMESEKKEFTAKRVFIYMIGIMLVSLGIVLCKKCGMGISPISSIPFVLSYMIPLTFGTLTTLFHFTNTILQMFFTKNFLNMKLWLQIPLAFVFGWVIDWFDRIIVLDENILIYQILALVFSIFFTALGMVCMLDMNLIQNPPDGTVKQISILMDKQLGTVKVGYDITCVILSISLGIIFLHEMKGFGIATIASAIFVGKTINWIRYIAQRMIEK